MNLPPFHGPMVFLTLSFRISPFALRVEENVAIRVTPRKSRWSDKVKKSKGTISCVREFRHFARGRNLHFVDPGVLCILHPELSSKMVITLSTNKNSYILVIAGFRSSQNAIILYLVSMEGSCVGTSARLRGGGGGRLGRA